MSLSYRTRQQLSRFGKTALIVLITAVTVLFCLLLWLRRFVVYTDEGVRLVFSHDQLPPAQQPALPTQGISVEIIFDDDPYQEGLTALNGYYLDPQDLMEDPAAVRRYLEALPTGTPVMVDLKGYRGYVYYPSRVGLTTSGSYDMAQMQAFLDWLTRSDLYVIGRISTLRDFDFAYHDNSVGLKKSGGSLYADRGSYGLGYWLNPTNEKVQSYLIEMIRELRNLGFDEVVLQNFTFPDTDDVVFEGDRAEALTRTADKIISACRTENFAISFSSPNPGYHTPDGCRLYLEDIPASSAQSAWEQVLLENKRSNLVFLAPNADTRYDMENGILKLLNILN